MSLESLFTAINEGDCDNCDKDPAECFNCGYCELIDGKKKSSEKGFVLNRYGIFNTLTKTYEVVGTPHRELVLANNDMTKLYVTDDGIRVGVYHNDNRGSVLRFFLNYCGTVQRYVNPANLKVLKIYG